MRELTNYAVVGNCMDILPTIPENSVDLIFADPPYNLQLKNELHRTDGSLVEGVNETWDQFNDFQNYDLFTEMWLTRCKAVMKDTSSIWISGSYHNIFRVGRILQDLHFWILNSVVWYKSNAMPNFRGVRLKSDVEVLIWAVKSKKARYTFHNEIAKTFNPRGTQLGSVWKIPICQGKERVKGEDGKKIHPAQKPEKLLERIISISSNEGDIVLDPFAGTGTTMIVAKRLNRHWIGIDQEEKYIRAFRERLESDGLGTT